MALVPRTLEARGDFGTMVVQASGSQKVEEPQGVPTVAMESENYDRIARLLDASSDLITVHEADGTFRFANAASQRLFGLAPEELTGSNPFRLVHPDDRDDVIEAMLRLRDEPSATHSFLVRARHGDGSWRHVEAVARNQLADPDVRGVVVVSRDVTDRVAAQEALAASEGRHRRLVESAPFGMTVIDGGCPLMFLPGDPGHRVMRTVLTATRKVPQKV